MGAKFNGEIQVAPLGTAEYAAVTNGVLIQTKFRGRLIVTFSVEQRIVCSAFR